jgi:hypothetical protein
LTLRIQGGSALFTEYFSSGKNLTLFDLFLAWVPGQKSVPSDFLKFGLLSFKKNPD